MVTWLFWFPYIGITYKSLDIYFEYYDPRIPNSITSLTSILIAPLKKSKEKEKKKQNDDNNKNIDLHTIFFFFFLTQIENSIAKEPKIQPTRANQRHPSGNQEKMLICGLSVLHIISCKVCALFVVTILNWARTKRER
jgi:hypothetical protein